MLSYKYINMKVDLEYYTQVVKAERVFEAYANVCTLWSLLVYSSVNIYHEHVLKIWEWIILLK